MERRFRVRLDELLQDAEVPPTLLRGLIPRLESFLQPFVASLQREEQRGNAQHYVQGLLSNLDDKNAEAIAYLHDQERQPLHVVPVEVRDERDAVEGAVLRLGQAVEAEAGAEVEDDRAMARLLEHHARGVAAVALVLSTRTRGRTPDAEKGDVQRDAPSLTCDGQKSFITIGAERRRDEAV